MNENVSIKEGNITRKFAPIDKVKVDNTDGTSSIWVPEDDLKTGVLYASENGIYIASEDGYDAYSEVVIRVEKRIDDGDLIDESGTDWKDIDFDGDVGNFDELDNWDVDTLEEFSDDLEGFDDLFNDEDKWDEEKEKPITEDEMDDFTGDSISGIDPETGNEMGVSLDEDGFLDEEVLPWMIEITKLPERTEFYDGHRIVFSGIKVSSVTDIDGEDVYKPIPYNELLFPVTIAILADESGSTYVSDLIPDGISPVTSYTTEILPQYDYPALSFEVLSGGTLYRRNGTTDLRILGASKEQGATVAIARRYNQRTGEEGISTEYTADNAYTHNGKTVYYITATWLGVGGDLPESNLDDAYVAWTIIYGTEEKATQTIPVQWIRPDGEMLETSYTITVLPDPSGGGSGGDSGGDSGGISYGGKDYMLNPNSVVGLSYDADSKKVIAPNIGEYNIDQAIDVGLLISKE